MTFETILFSVEDGIATLTLNRPKKFNALDMLMRREIAQVVSDITLDASVRALIVTGSGGNFCSGGDIATMQTRTPGPEAARLRMRDNWDWVKGLVNLDIPVIAAVDGVAAGAGFNIALMTDFVLATGRATFCQSFTRVGLVPDVGGMYLLPRVVGLQAAKELVFSARTLNAEEARSMGIVYRVVAEGALLAEAASLARRMSRASRTSIGLAKGILNNSYQSDLDNVLRVEAAANGMCFETPYHKDAIDRFLKKTPLVFEPFSSADIAAKNK